MHELLACSDRKKELSAHNETLADDFKDAITESLQTAVDCVGEFADDQTVTLGDLRAQLGRMILARQEVSLSGVFRQPLIPREC